LREIVLENKEVHPTLGSLNKVLINGLAEWSCSISVLVSPSQTSISARRLGR
jgi:hypothetical protein